MQTHIYSPCVVFWYPFHVKFPRPFFIAPVELPSRKLAAAKTVATRYHPTFSPPLHVPRRLNNRREFHRDMTKKGGIERDLARSHLLRYVVR